MPYREGGVRIIIIPIIADLLRAQRLEQFFCK